MADQHPTKTSPDTPVHTDYVWAENAPDSSRDAIELLQSWRQGDELEQRETLEYLKDALDSDRLSDRKLFP